MVRFRFDQACDQHVAFRLCYNRSTSMKCLKCGAEQPDGAKFCNECGSKMDLACPVFRWGRCRSMSCSSRAAEGACLHGALSKASQAGTF
ncbi:MAG: zinc-ribbon domain-containing protein [Syntrophobacteraceae bacterium]